MKMWGKSKNLSFDSIGYDEKRLLGSDASSSQDMSTGIDEESLSLDKPEECSQNENKSPRSLEGVEHSRSMASEVTHNVAHLPPKKTKGAYPEEVSSPASSGVLSTISDQPQPNYTSNISINLSKSYSSRVPRILANHQRIPGGAAAKLIGRKENDEYHFVNDGDDALEVRAPLEELMKSREKAVAEFSVGSTQNKRYHAPKREENTKDILLTSEGSLPRILDRDEVFHNNATAAIVSILTPSNKSKNGSEIEDILSA